MSISMLKVLITIRIEKNPTNQKVTLGRKLITLCTFGLVTDWKAS